MYNKFKEIIEENKYIFLWITISVLIIFGIFIFLDRPFLINADQQLQYNIFYTEWIRLLKDFIKNGQFPFYSWNLFLGTDFWSTRAFHVIGDPLLPIVMLFKNIEIGLLIETIILVYISAISMNVMLKIFGISNRKTRTYVSCVYALCGWASLFYGQYMFHRFYAFLPFLFYGIENYFNNKRILPYILASFILFMQNYYLMFPTAIFMVIYCLFSLNLKCRMNIKDISKNFIVLFFGLIVGFLLSAFLVLPAALYLINNSRVASGDSNLLWDFNVYLGMLMQFIVSPFPVYTDYPNIFYSGTNGHAYWYSFFVGILPTIGTLTLVFKNGQNFKKYGIPLVILILCLVIKPISSIFHGFSEATFRWSFLFIFFWLLLSSIYYNKSDDQLKFNKMALIYGIIFTISMVLCAITGYMVLDIHVAHIVNIIVCVLFAILILTLYKRYKVLAFTISILQLALSSAFLLYQYNRNYYEYVPSINSEYVEYFASQDEDLLYRMYVDPSILLPSSPMNLNQSVNYGFMTTTTYDSLFEYGLSTYLNNLNYDWHIIDINDYQLLHSLGVKYYIVYSEDDLPDGDFEYVYNLNHLQVYEDLNYDGFAFTINPIAFEFNVESCDYKDCFVSEKIISTQEDSIKFDVLNKYNNGLNGYIYLENPSILYFSIPYNEGWTVIDNGIKIPYFKINDGFIGLELSTGEHFIEMNFISRGFRSGLLMTIAGLAILVVIVCWEKIYAKKG